MIVADGQGIGKNQYQQYAAFHSRIKANEHFVPATIGFVRGTELIVIKDLKLFAAELFKWSDNREIPPGSVIINARQVAHTLKGLAVRRPCRRPFGPGYLRYSRTSL